MDRYLKNEEKDIFHLLVKENLLHLSYIISTARNQENDSNLNYRGDETIKEYYPDAVYPMGGKSSDYEVSNIENTYCIQGEFSDNARKEYIIIFTEKEDKPYILNSFYVDGEKIYGDTLKKLV